jgi:hypothetical protein
VIAEVIRSDERRAAHHGGRVLRTWRPRELDLNTAGTVVYVHGYDTTVDDAWEQHRLAAQFQLSRQNAIFAAVSGPASRNEPVAWPRLSDVRDAQTSLTGQSPTGPVVVVAHSGGYRTVASWIQRGDVIDQVGLLDALYGDVDDLTHWIGDPAAPQRSMNLVSCDNGRPRANAERLIAGLRRQPTIRVAHRHGVPARYEDFTWRQRRARLLHVVAQQTHMGLVLDGAVLPVILRRSPLRLITSSIVSSGGIS